MTTRTQNVVAGLMALVACGLIAAGCGDDESTTADSTSTTTSSTASGDASAEERIDAAVESCTAEAQDLGEAAASGLQAACTTVGDNAKQALAAGGDQVEQGLAQAADSCKTAVSQLPAGDAQAALTDLCAAIEAG
jgi:hypothetical protein